MDQHCNWGDVTFRNRCGESLSLAVNLIADVLHSFYILFFDLVLFSGFDFEAPWGVVFVAKKRSASQGN
jgi:hypothetical protein